MYFSPEYRASYLNLPVFKCADDYGPAKLPGCTDTHNEREVDTLHFAEGSTVDYIDNGNMSAEITQFAEEVSEKLTRKSGLCLHISSKSACLLCK